MLPEHLAVLPEEIRARAVRADIRSRRYRSLAALWDISTLDRVRKCSRMPVGAMVTVGVSDGVGSVRGVSKCASVHACTVCGPKIRQGRADEIRRAGLAHLDAGGELLFPTLTVPHRFGQSLKELWDLVAGAWSDVIGSDEYRFLEVLYGGVVCQAREGSRPRTRIGMVRALEVTCGRNGWHPHLHNLAMVREMSDEDVEDFEGQLYELWRRAVLARGGDEPSRKHGIRVERVRSAGQLSEYLVGLEGTRVDLELARADLKLGKSGGLSPWAILADVTETGDMASVAAWREWEQASWRRNHITWTQGLKRALGVEERSDEDLAAEETGQVDVLIMLGSAWQAIARRRWCAPLLSAVERGSREAVIELLDRAGVDLGSVWWIADLEPG